MKNCYLYQGALTFLIIYDWTVTFIVKFVDIVVISVNTDPSPFVNFVSLSLWGPFCVSTYFRSYVCIVKSFFGLFIKENITFLLLSRNFNFNRRQESTQRSVLPLSFPAELLLPYIAISYSWLQNLFTYETIMYFKWNDIFCGTFWCMYQNYVKF